jgi:hypothetical protein
MWFWGAAFWFIGQVAFALFMYRRGVRREARRERERTLRIALAQYDELSLSVRDWP